MKEKIIYTVLVMACYLAAIYVHAQVQITDQQAVQMVMNIRNSSAPAIYYIGETNQIINDYRCPIDTMPTQQWATSNEDKWLVFVDEQPNYAWGHECSYYYLPQEVDNSNNVPYLHYYGILPPDSISLTMMNSSVPQASYYQISVPDYPAGGNDAPQFLDGNVMDTHIIIYSSLGGPNDNEAFFRWNEVSAFYKIARSSGIPKSNIDVVMDFGDEDLDDDDISDRSVWSDFGDCLNSLRGKSPEHLIIYFACAASDLSVGSNPSFMTNLPDLVPLNLNGWNQSQVEDMFSVIDAKKISVFLSCNVADRFAPYIAKSNRDVSCATKYSNDLGAITQNVYFEQPYKWLSALAGKDLITNAPVNADYNNDGWVSMNEAFEYIRPLVVSQGDTSCYYSQPTSLGGNLGLIHMPVHTRLSIRQSDTNSPANVLWNSPDIWVRAIDDGLAHQENECITVQEGSEVYVYTRIVATGSSSSYLPDQKLHLVWNHSHLGLPGYITNPEAGDIEEYEWAELLPHLISSVNIAGFYHPGDTVIVKYKWTIPEAVAQASEPLGGILAVNLGAILSPNTYASISDGGYNAITRRMVQKNLITINPAYLPTHIVQTQQPLPLSLYNEGQFPISLYNLSRRYWERDFSIGIMADSASSNANMFSLLNIGFEVSPYMENGWFLSYGEELEPINAVQDPSNTRRYRFLGTNSKLNHIGIQMLSCDTISFYCNAPGLLTLPTDNWQLFHVLFNTPSTSYGQAIKLIVEGSASGPILPMINAIPNRGETYTLSEINIDEPARYEWFGSELNKLNEGKSITANAEDVGNVCIVKVTRQSDGREKYAIAQLDNVPRIEVISPVPVGGSMTIRLTNDAVDGMMVRIYPVVGGSAIEQVLIEGERETVVNTENLLPGYYVVALIRNGQVLQSLHVVK